MIFISAGHHSKHPVNPDPGAIGNGYKEGDLTIEFRDLVSRELTARGVSHVKDIDTETLQQYVNRIKTDSGSVVIEFHFDAAAAPSATGTTSLIEVDADRLDKAFAKELADTTALILGIKNRGIKTEADTRHKRLALMTENGIVCLLELGFITNIDDIKAYQAKKVTLAKAIADILIKYERMLS